MIKITPMMKYSIIFSYSIFYKDKKNQEKLSDRGSCSPAPTRILYKSHYKGFPVKDHL